MVYVYNLKYSIKNVFTLVTNAVVSTSAPIYKRWITLYVDIVNFLPKATLRNMKISLTSLTFYL